MNTPRADSDLALTDRWHAWLGVTIGLHVGTFILYPIFICGCDFHAMASLVGAVPILWTAFTIFASRSKRERILAAINMVLAVGWLYLEWESNLQFLFWSYGSRPM